MLLDTLYDEGIYFLIAPSLTSAEPYAFIIPLVFSHSYTTIYFPVATVTLSTPVAGLLTARLKPKEVFVAFSAIDVGEESSIL